MILLQPPAPAPDGGYPPPLSISRIVRRAFDSTSDVEQPATAPDPELHRFLVDLLAPYGQVPNPHPVERTYAGMAEALLRPSGLLDTQFDLVVLAYAVPDADPRWSMAHVLHRLCPGNPLAFAIGDQGVAAPFTAVATAHAYLRSGFERALILILEQATLGYPAVEPVTLPELGSAVALVLEPAGAVPLVSVDQRMAVAPERVGAVLAGMADAVPPDSVVVLGSGLAGHVEQAQLGVPAARVRVAPPGRLCTSVWWELADLWEDHPSDRPGVLLADYDPVLGTVCVLALGPHIAAAVREGSRIATARSPVEEIHTVQ